MRIAVIGIGGVGGYFGGKLARHYAAGGDVKIEIDIFTGYIVKKGKGLGIPTLLHDKVYAKLIKT